MTHGLFNTFKINSINCNSLFCIFKCILNRKRPQGQEPQNFKQQPHNQQQKEPQYQQLKYKKTTVFKIDLWPVFR